MLLQKVKKKKTKKAKDGSDSDSDDDDESSDDSDDEMSLERRIPKSHEVQLNHGSKAISAMAIDPSGSRLVTGSIDYEVKFWDFAGMDASLRSFRLVSKGNTFMLKDDWDSFARNLYYDQNASVIPDQFVLVSRM